MRNDGTQAKRQRERMGLSRPDLAKIIGCNLQSIYDYEKTRTLSEKVIDKLRLAFGRDWHPDNDVFYIPQGVDALVKLLQSKGVKLTVKKGERGQLIYFKDATN